jgi:hypothetical protein
MLALFCLIKLRDILLLEASIDTSAFVLNGHGGISKAPSRRSGARQGGSSQ